MMGIVNAAGIARLVDMQIDVEAVFARESEERVQRLVQLLVDAVDGLDRIGHAAKNASMARGQFGELAPERT